MKLAALIIEGSNGPQYIRVILYPQDWGGNEAEIKAWKIIKDLSAEKVDKSFDSESCDEADADYTWDECKARLEAAGFTVPCWRTAEFFWDVA